MKTRKALVCIAGVLFLLAMVPFVSHSEVPQQINYQGYLTDAGGGNPLDGNYSILFTIYDAGGTDRWSETQDVNVVDGNYSVQLGQLTSFPADLFDGDLYLGVKVGTDAEMAPRLPITSVAFAMKADDADTLNGFDSTAFLSTDGGLADLDLNNLLVQGLGSFDNNGEEGILYLGSTNNYIKAVHGSGVRIGAYNAGDALAIQDGTGNVGIGVTIPGAKLDVNGTIQTSADVWGYVRLGRWSSEYGGSALSTHGGSTFLSIQIEDSEKLRIQDNGNVGIGVTDPTQRLSVNGTIESKTGGFKFPDGTTQASAGTSQAYVNGLEARIVSLESKMVALETLLANVTRSGNDITFSGVNVHVVNGTGTTDGTVNGSGNLIVGYNETREPYNHDYRTGSHNIVVGMENNYSSYGGLVAGRFNTIAGISSTVSGGISNTASGDFSSVSGGIYNSAIGWNSSVSGGTNSSANGRYSSVSGGRWNSANGEFSSVSGGQNNKASGQYSFVGGGGGDTASEGNEAFARYSAILGGASNIAGDNTNPDDHSIGELSTISGGYGNTASGNHSSVSGGRYNKASGDWSFVGGGGHPLPQYGNEAFSHYSAILGGTSNIAGDNTNPDDHSIGELSTISGGATNRASGWYSSVSGGRNNTASGDYSFVGGGGHPNPVYGNEAFSNLSAILGGAYNITGDKASNDHNIGELSTISGGDANRAKGGWSSISGGQGNDASGPFSSISGGNLNITSDDFSSISGGKGNEASGNSSSVSGGYYDYVTGDYDWRAGDDYFSED